MEQLIGLHWRVSMWKGVYTVQRWGHRSSDSGVICDELYDGLTSAEARDVLTADVASFELWPGDDLLVRDRQVLGRQERLFRL